ncbi:MAG: hypothetical protein WKG07_30630 [Hymenobacter sp.]
MLVDYSGLSDCTTDETNLLGYRKGTEAWGQLTPLAQLLPAAAATAAATTAAFS